MAKIRLTGLLRKPLLVQGFLFLHASPVHHGTRERWPSRNSVVGLTRLVEPKLQLPGAAATELRKAVAYRRISTVDSLLTLRRAASRLGGHVETQPLRRGQFSRRSRRGRPIRRLGRDGGDAVDVEIDVLTAVAKRRHEGDAELSGG